jgi:hypothetical protein
MFCSIYSKILQNGRNPYELLKKPIWIPRIVKNLVKFEIFCYFFSLVIGSYQVNHPIIFFENYLILRKRFDPNKACWYHLSLPGLFVGVEEKINITLTTEANIKNLFRHNLLH